MMADKFEGLVFNCIYVGIQPITIEKSGIYENKILLYFSREIDSAEVPLCLSEIQAQQLLEDLEKIFQEK
jgi:hypothetical protein